MLNHRRWGHAPMRNLDKSITYPLCKKKEIVLGFKNSKSMSAFQPIVSQIDQACPLLGMI